MAIEASHEQIERYQALVEQEMLRGLTAEEAREMERLGEEIDCSFDDFYHPIIERLERAVRVKQEGKRDAG